MNKFFKIIMAILGGCNQVMMILTPLAIGLFWVLHFGANNFGDILVLVIALLSALFIAIKTLVEN